MKDVNGRRMVMHPAWQAAHELLSDGETWWHTLADEPGGYTHAQLATAMRCMGYGDDVIETAWKGGRAVAWEFPAAWIAVNHNQRLAEYPGLLALVELPTLPEELEDPEEFVAGFVLVDAGVHALPVDVLAVLNGVEG